MEFRRLVELVAPLHSAGASAVFQRLKEWKPAELTPDEEEVSSSLTDSYVG
jgi:hypothetical protein